jgi:hypothetical protein
MGSVPGFLGGDAPLSMRELQDELAAAAAALPPPPPLPTAAARSAAAARAPSPRQTSPRLGAAAADAEAPSASERGEFELALSVSAFRVAADAFLPRGRAALRLRASVAGVEVGQVLAPVTALSTRTRSHALPLTLLVNVGVGTVARAELLRALERVLAPAGVRPPRPPQPQPQPQPPPQPPAEPARAERPKSARSSARPAAEPLGAAGSAATAGAAATAAGAPRPRTATRDGGRGRDAAAVAAAAAAAAAAAEAEAERGVCELRLALWAEGTVGTPAEPAPVGVGVVDLAEVLRRGRELPVALDAAAAAAAGAAGAAGGGLLQVCVPLPDAAVLEALLSAAALPWLPSSAAAAADAADAAADAAAAVAAAAVSATTLAAGRTRSPRSSVGGGACLAAPSAFPRSPHRGCASLAASPRASAARLHGSASSWSLAASTASARSSGGGARSGGVGAAQRDAMVVGSAGARDDASLIILISDAGDEAAYAVRPAAGGEPRPLAFESAAEAGRCARALDALRARGARALAGVASARARTLSSRALGQLRTQLGGGPLLLLPAGAYERAMRDALAVGELVGVRVRALAPVAAAARALRLHGSAEAVLAAEAAASTAAAARDAALAGARVFGPDVFVSLIVEHCVAPRPTFSLRGSAARYEATFEALRAAVEAELREAVAEGVELRVAANPTPRPAWLGAVDAAVADDDAEGGAGGGRGGEAARAADAPTSRVALSPRGAASPRPPPLALATAARSPRARAGVASAYLSPRAPSAGASSAALSPRGGSGVWSAHSPVGSGARAARARPLAAAAAAAGQSAAAAAASAWPRVGAFEVWLRVERHGVTLVQTSVFSKLESSRFPLPEALACAVAQAACDALTAAAAAAGRGRDGAASAGLLGARHGTGGGPLAFGGAGADAPVFMISLPPADIASRLPLPPSRPGRWAAAQGEAGALGEVGASVEALADPDAEREKAAFAGAFDTAAYAAAFRSQAPFESRSGAPPPPPHAQQPQQQQQQPRPQQPTLQPGATLAAAKAAADGCDDDRYANERFEQEEPQAQAAQPQPQPPRAPLAASAASWVRPRVPAAAGGSAGVDMPQPGVGGGAMRVGAWVPMPPPEVSVPETPRASSGYDRVRGGGGGGGGGNDGGGRGGFGGEGSTVPFTPFSGGGIGFGGRTDGDTANGLGAALADGTVGAGGDCEPTASGASAEFDASDVPPFVVATGFTPSASGWSTPAVRLTWEAVDAAGELLASAPELARLGADSRALTTATDADEAATAPLPTLVEEEGADGTEHAWLAAPADGTSGAGVGREPTASGASAEFDASDVPPFVVKTGFTPSASGWSTPAVRLTWEAVDAAEVLASAPVLARLGADSRAMTTATDANAANANVAADADIAAPLPTLIEEESAEGAEHASPPPTAQTSPPDPPCADATGAPLASSPARAPLPPRLPPRWPTTGGGGRSSASASAISIRPTAPAVRALAVIPDAAGAAAHSPADGGGGGARGRPPALGRLAAEGVLAGVSEEEAEVSAATLHAEPAATAPSAELSGVQLRSFLGGRGGGGSDSRRRRGVSSESFGVEQLQAAQVAMAAVLAKGAPPPRREPSLPPLEFAAAKASLGSNRLLARVSEAARDACARALVRRDVAAGEAVVTQGERMAEHCYIVKEGARGRASRVSMSGLRLAVELSSPSVSLLAVPRLPAPFAFPVLTSRLAPSLCLLLLPRNPHRLWSSSLRQAPSTSSWPSPTCRHLDATSRPSAQVTRSASWPCSTTRRARRR